MAEVHHVDHAARQGNTKPDIAAIKARSAEIAREPWRISKALAKDRRWSRRKAMFRDFLEVWLSAKDGKAFPTQKQIAFRLQVSVRAVREMIAEATHLGYLIPVRERRNQYYVAISDGSQSRWQRGANVPHRTGTDVPLQRGTNVPHSYKAPETNTPETKTPSRVPGLRPLRGLESSPSLRSVEGNPSHAHKADESEQAADREIHPSVEEESQPALERVDKSESDSKKPPAELEDTSTARACESPPPLPPGVRRLWRPHMEEIPASDAEEPERLIRSYLVGWAMGWAPQMAERRLPQLLEEMPPDTLERLCERRKAGTLTLTDLAAALVAAGLVQFVKEAA